MTDPQEAQAALPPVYFYDSADGKFPADATHVMAYADGDFKSDPDIYQDYQFVHSITVDGVWQALTGDYEPGTELFDVPGRARDWTEKRLARHQRAIPYSDRADLHLLRAELGPMLWAHPLVLFWIPTLDGRFWTQLELSQDIAVNWGVWIPPQKIWANQGKNAQQSGGDWDTSILLGTW